MAKTKAHNPVPVEQIPEVAAFAEVQARYRAYREANPEFFNYLDALAEEYNEKRQAADKAVRAREVTCGEFTLYQYQTKYDAEAAFSALGESEFLKAGGKVSTVTVHELDRARFDAAVANGQVPKEIAESVIKKSPRYKKPDPIDIP